MTLPAWIRPLGLAEHLVVGGVLAAHRPPSLTVSSHRSASQGLPSTHGRQRNRNSALIGQGNGTPRSLKSTGMRTIDRTGRPLRRAGRNRANARYCETGIRNPGSGVTTNWIVSASTNRDTTERDAYPERPAAPPALVMGRSAAGHGADCVGPSVEPCVTGDNRGNQSSALT